jgi:hypothetical protein
MMGTIAEIVNALGGMPIIAHLLWPVLRHASPGLDDIPRLLRALYLQYRFHVTHPPNQGGDFLPPAPAKVTTSDKIHAFLRCQSIPSALVRSMLHVADRQEMGLTERAMQALEAMVRVCSKLVVNTRALPELAFYHAGNDEALGMEWASARLVSEDRRKRAAPAPMEA